MKNRQKGQTGTMVVKLDISKAYKRLEWSFLEAMMRKINFDEVWISRIMRCVTTVSYIASINGKSGSIVKPSRGLHQRDPISPYLCLLCVKGLSLLLNKAENSFKIKGVKVARWSLTINHIFFPIIALLCSIGPILRNGVRYKSLWISMKPLWVRASTNTKLVFYSSNTSRESRN